MYFVAGATGETLSISRINSTDYRGKLAYKTPGRLPSRDEAAPVTRNTATSRALLDHKRGPFFEMRIQLRLSHGGGMRVIYTASDLLSACSL